MKFGSNKWLAAALLAAAVGGVQAQDMATIQARAWAATCAQCHGTAGHAVDGSEVPGLAGRPASVLIDQMKAFKSGARPASVMHQIAKGYSEAQIEQMAVYFAMQKR